MTNEELVALIQGGDREKLPQLWEQVERFVAQQANRRLVLSGGLGGVEFGDLYNAGYLALVAAVDTFDPEAGRSFTLAAATIVWNYVGEVLFNMLVLVGAIKMSDRLVRELMGLG